MTKEEMSEIKKCITEALKNKGSTAEPGKHIYEKVEKILYSLSGLREKVLSDLADIEDMKKEQEIQETNHKLLKPEEWDAEIDDEIRFKQKIRNRERAAIRTQKLIERVDRCLDKIKDDEYSKIIPLFYFKRMNALDIANGFGCSDRTIARQKKRLVEELTILIYGADALE